MYQTLLLAEKLDPEVHLTSESAIETILINDLEMDQDLQLFDKAKSVNQEDETCKKLRDAIQEHEKSYDGKLLKEFKSIENILFFRDKLWVFNSDELKLTIIREIHDQQVIGHFGIRNFIRHQEIVILAQNEGISDEVRSKLSHL